MQGAQRVPVQLHAEPRAGGTATAPSRKVKAPGTMTSSSFHGQWVSNAYVRLVVAAATWVIAAKLMPR